MTGRQPSESGPVYQRGRRGGRPGQWVAVADLGKQSGERNRREFTATTRAAAVTKRTRFLDARRDGFTLPKGRPPYVEEWFRHWLYNVIQDRVAATTFERSYRQKGEDLVIPFFEGISLPALDTEDIEAWHRHLKREVSPRTGSPRSAKTITDAHRLLSSALNLAVARKRIPHNPCLLVHPPTPAAARPEPPTESEVMAILRECEDRRTGPRWVTAIASAARQGEALGLLWPCLELDDTEDASVAFEWELVRLAWKHGCGDAHACGGPHHRYPCPEPCPRIRASGRPHVCVQAGDKRCCPPGCTGHARRCPARHGGGLRLKRPKTEKSRGVVPLAPYAAAMLRQWKADQAAERLAHPAWVGWAHGPQACAGRPRLRELVCPECMLPARAGLLVFAQPDGRPVDPRADWQDWSDLLGDAGAEHTGTHGTRHETATLLLEAGEDIAVVAEILRHANPDFTRRVYQHVRPKLKRRAAAALDQALRRR